MKKILGIVVLLAAGGLLARTNPDADAFRTWVQSRVQERLADGAGEGTLGRILTDLGSSVAGTVASKAAERQDWLLFSLYTIDVGADARPEDRWRFLGIAGQFFEIAAPEALK